MNLTAFGQSHRPYSANIYDRQAKYYLLSELYMTKKKVYPVHFTGQRGQQEASEAFLQNETSTRQRWLKHYRIIKKPQLRPAGVCRQKTILSGDG